MLMGFNVAVGPLGVTVALRNTDPVKLFNDLSVIVDVPDAPSWNVIEVGLVDMLKSVPTWIETSVE